MALIKCSEGGKAVSDKAAACPGCGAPLPAAAAVRVTVDKAPVRVIRAGWRWEAIGALLVIGGLIAAIAGAGGFGWFVLIVGFVIFMIGRFLN